MKIYSTLMHLRSLGEKDGRERGIQEGGSRQLGKLILRHGKRLYGLPDQGAQDLLDTLVDRSALGLLEQVEGRLLRAEGWAGLLEGIAPPAERPADPDYLVPFEFDPTPMPPSIDEYAKVTLLGGGPAIVHIRMQRLYQDNIGAVLHKESERLQAEHHCPVQTVVLLLWPGADGPAMTGEYELPTGGTYRYSLTRLWEKDVDEMLQSIATAALAPLGKGAEERLPEVVRKMEEVIETKARNEEDKAKVWVVAYGSMGLRYPAKQVNALLAHKLPFLYQTEECRSIMSDGYYAGYSQGLEEGAVQVTRRWVLTLGAQRLGPAPEETAQALEAVRNLERMEQLAARALKGATWPEVLAPG